MKHIKGGHVSTTYHYKSLSLPLSLSVSLSPSLREINLIHCSTSLSLVLSVTYDDDRTHLIIQNVILGFLLNL